MSQPLHKSVAKIVMDMDIDSNFIDSMQVSDQIMVEYSGIWYNATIIEIKVIDNISNTKQFKVRYNPKDDSNGAYPFWTNTEWFHCRGGEIKEEERLRYPGKLVTNESGDTVEWQSPPFAFRANIQQIQINDHILARSGSGNLVRSKVISISDDMEIAVKDLVSGNTYKGRYEFLCVSMEDKPEEHFYYGWRFHIPTGSRSLMCTFWQSAKELEELGLLIKTEPIRCFVWQVPHTRSVGQSPDDQR